MLTLLVLASALAVQQVRAPTAAVSPDTAFVGDVVSVAFRIDAPANSQLQVPDTLVLGEQLENAARARIRTDTLENGSLRHTVYYAVVGWQPGVGLLPSLEGSLRTPTGVEAFRVDAPPITIASVLPADTAGIQPRPLKDVIGPTRVWWMMALAIAALLLLISLLIWWWMRRRVRKQEIAIAAPAIPPRERLLRELDEIATGPLRQGDLRVVYIRLSTALRRYMAVLDTDWGEDLTTTELSANMRNSELEVILDLLGRSDLVKFARYAVTQEEAQRDLGSARHWAESYRQPGETVLVEAA